jgi:hypothetical protein
MRDSELVTVWHDLVQNEFVRRLLKKAPSKVRDGRNNERHPCARRRAGEAAVPSSSSERRWRLFQEPYASSTAMTSIPLYVPQLRQV